MGDNALSQRHYNYNPKPCKMCGQTFQPTNSCHVYCAEECRQASLRHGYLRRNYGITVPEYDALLEKQNGVCAICNQEGVKINSYAEHTLMVDHCHSTGRIRGLLCANCNRGLGLFKDSSSWLRKAATYLEE